MKTSQNRNKIKVGVIPAAGAGKRLGYLSGLLPKALFPVYDRPIIHGVVDQMQSLGVEDVYIIVGVFKEKIIEYFNLIKMDLKANIHFLEQQKLGGTGEAILMTEKYVKDQSFLTIYGDDCTVTKSLHEMEANFFDKKPVVMEGVVREYDKKILSQTCSVKMRANGKMYEIIEKPENPPYMMRGCGLYMFSPEIFEHIKNTPVHPIRNEREITYTINMLAKEGKAYGHVIEGHNVNINDSDELLKASHLVKMLKNSPIDALNEEDMLNTSVKRIVLGSQLN